jgi:hypothetical protein
LPPDTVTPQCTYADSVVQFIKTKVVNLFGDAATATEIISVIVSATGTILALLSSTVVGGIIIALMGAAALLIAIFGGAAFKALFTDDVWNKLRCNIDANINSDGSFTQAEIDSIYAQCAIDYSGVLKIFLQQLIASWGTIGMTNAARSGLGAADATCDCDCPSPCTVDWTFYGVHADTIVKLNDCHYTMTTDASLGHFAFSSGDMAVGCYFNFTGLGVYSSWGLGSATPNGVDPHTSQIWNFDYGGYSDGTELDLHFSSAPF